jgi:hypothetical protein
MESVCSPRTVQGLDTLRVFGRLVDRRTEIRHVPGGGGRGSTGAAPGVGTGTGCVPWGAVRGGVGARGRAARGRGTCPWRCRARSRVGGSVPAPQPPDRARLNFSVPTIGALDWPTGTGSAEFFSWKMPEETHQSRQPAGHRRYLRLLLSS